MPLQRATDDPQLRRLLDGCLGLLAGADAPPAGLFSAGFSGVAAGGPLLRDGAAWLARARRGLAPAPGCEAPALGGVDLQELAAGVVLATLELRLGPAAGAPAARLSLALRREVEGWRVRHADLAVAAPATAPAPAEAVHHAVAEAAEAAGLTAREAEVLGRLREGKANREIAGVLGISPRTVQKHVERVLAKMGARSRLDAVRRTLG